MEMWVIWTVTFSHWLVLQKYVKTLLLILGKTILISIYLAQKLAEILALKVVFDKIII